MLREGKTMNDIPQAAIGIAIALLLVMGFFLAHMISSQEQDARLEFLLHLLETLPRSGVNRGTGRSGARGPGNPEQRLENLRGQRGTLQAWPAGARGWLAREDKLEILREKRTFRMSLT